MSDTINVPRELLERSLKADASKGASYIELVAGWNAMEQLRALLQASAQPAQVQECEAPSCGCADAYCKAWDAAPKPSDDVDRDALVVAASAALLEIECLMKEAYNSATPVCCQRAGQECCGDSLPEWSEYDQRTMDRFAPHQRALNEALRAIDAAMGQGGGE